MCLCWPSKLVEMREILQKYFVMPSTVRIMKNHVFSFRSEAPGAVFVKEYTTSNSELRHNLILNMHSADTIAAEIAKALIFENNKNVWPELHNVKSKKYGTRRNYLHKEILERYFKEDQAFEDVFFANGSLESVP
eukprot:IDg879t1